jgi:type VI secretion system protein ImpA
MQFTAEELAQPISEELPCGEDLEYVDPAFQQMEVMMQSTEEQEYGDTIIPASGPDWKGVAEQVNELMPKTRDLRILTNAALSDLHLTGVNAFSDSLYVLNTCMETFWDHIYPELDVDDNNDATMRFNVLQTLNDHDLVCTGLENAPLVEIKGLGAFSLRDIELSEGKITPANEEEEVHDIALIQGAFGDSDAEALATLVEGVEGSITQLKRTAELWDQLATNSVSISIEETLKVLSEVKQAIARYAPAAVIEEEEETDEVAESGASTGAKPVSGTINDRADVIRMLDKICDYYTVNEPSSPIPLLLRRAQRLVPKSFFEILADIVPDSVPQAQSISGHSDDQG